MSKKHKKQKRNKQQNQSQNQATSVTPAAEAATVAAEITVAQASTPNLQARQDPNPQRNDVKNLLPGQRPSNPDICSEEMRAEISLPPAGRMRSRAMYEVFQELFRLARSCALQERCYADDKELMCNLRDRIERLRQNDCEFDSLVAETTQHLVVQMKRINFWGDRIYDLYRTLDSIDDCERRVTAAANKLSLG